MYVHTDTAVTVYKYVKKAWPSLSEDWQFHTPKTWSAELQHPHSEAYVRFLTWKPLTEMKTEKNKNKNPIHSAWNTLLYGKKYFSLSISLYDTIYYLWGNSYNPYAYVRYSTVCGLQVIGILRWSAVLWKYFESRLDTLHF